MLPEGVDPLGRPVTFAGETRTRKEDELIAYSWDKFLRTGDEKWPARLPMTKSGSRTVTRCPPRAKLRRSSGWGRST